MVPLAFCKRPSAPRKKGEKEEEKREEKPGHQITGVAAFGLSTIAIALFDRGLLSHNKPGQQITRGQTTTPTTTPPPHHHSTSTTTSPIQFEGRGLSVTTTTDATTANTKPGGGGALSCRAFCREDMEFAHSPRKCDQTRMSHQLGVRLGDARRCFTPRHGGRQLSLAAVRPSDDDIAIQTSVN